MLTQNHVSVVKGFLGQTTGFRKDLIKKSVVLLGEDQVHSEVKYLHGNFGRGTFTFLGGHDPEDYQHAVGDPPTELSLHKTLGGIPPHSEQHPLSCGEEEAAKDLTFSAGSGQR